MVTPPQGRILVRLARQQIEEQLGLPASQPVTAAELSDPVFQQKKGVFVTLHKRKTLRGCIGSLAAAEELAAGIRRHALNAAFHDHRFAPVSADEVAELHIEVSVLTDPQPLDYTGADQLVERLRPGVDGVICKGQGGESATFLPQVWQQLPMAEQFLAHLCRKAGLADQAWRAGNLTIFTYQVQSFEEPVQARYQS